MPDAFSSTTLDFISLILTLAGLGVAVWEIRRVASSAEAAEEAAKKVLTRVHRSKSVEDLTAVIQNLEVIRFLIRNRHWEPALSRFATVRHRLNECISHTQALTSRDRSNVQSAIVRLKGVEEQIEALALGVRPYAQNDILRFSTQVAGTITQTRTVLANVRKAEVRD